MTIKKPQVIHLGFLTGGTGGIRTRGGLLTHTRFPGVRLKPLIHRSRAFDCSSGNVRFELVRTNPLVPQMQVFS